MNINNYCYFHLNVTLEHLDLFLSRLSLLVRADLEDDKIVEQ